MPGWWLAGAKLLSGGSLPSVTGGLMAGCGLGPWLADGLGDFQSPKASQVLQGRPQSAPKDFPLPPEDSQDMIPGSAGHPKKFRVPPTAGVLVKLHDDHPVNKMICMDFQKFYRFQSIWGCGLGRFWLGWWLRLPV